jgi:hypothetical protein
MNLTWKNGEKPIVKPGQEVIYKKNKGDFEF